MERYTGIDLEIIEFDSEDVIVQSGGGCDRYGIETPDLP